MPNNNDTSELGAALQDVTDKAQKLIHDEIELAKAEVIEKVTKLLKGAAVGIAAGIFAVFGLIYLLHALAWLIWDLIGSNRDFWLGFLIVAGLLFVLGGLAGFMAAKLVKRGSPPVPKMAIQEAQLIKETVTSAHPSTPQGPTEVTR
jgi:uncharacterized membrane protein YqjE